MNMGPRHSTTSLLGPWSVGPVIGLGEVLWDVFGKRRQLGGAPANVAFQAHQLGVPSYVVSRIGADALGNDLQATMLRRGLTVDFVQRDLEHPTGTVTVELNESAEAPEYTIHESVAYDYLDFHAKLSHLMQSAGAVCFGTLAQRSEHSRHTIYQCLSATPPHCLKVYDVNFR